MLIKFVSCCTQCGEYIKEKIDHISEIDYEELIANLHPTKDRFEFTLNNRHHDAVYESDNEICESCHNKTGWAKVQLFSSERSHLILRDELANI